MLCRRKKMGTRNEGIKMRGEYGCSSAIKRNKWVFIRVSDRDPKPQFEESVSLRNLHFSKWEVT